MKRKLKSITPAKALTMCVICMVISIISVSFAASTFIASQVTYKPANSNWQVNNIQEALDSLRSKDFLQYESSGIKLMGTQTITTTKSYSTAFIVFTGQGGSGWTFPTLNAPSGAQLIDYKYVLDGLTYDSWKAGASTSAPNNYAFWIYKVSNLASGTTISASTNGYMAITIYGD
jgi:hypothetical protein